ncbi:STC-like protein [Mya arenaria]|uniref:STC-like protein n=1 Tax=Mya arenaria TaxID=6604 RepID=A0ABY7DG90_MYAAR|nr:STC-like protein [Mya arenaria]
MGLALEAVLEELKTLKNLFENKENYSNRQNNFNRKTVTSSPTTPTTRAIGVCLQMDWFCCNISRMCIYMDYGYKDCGEDESPPAYSKLEIGQTKVEKVVEEKVEQAPESSTLLHFTDRPASLSDDITWADDINGADDTPGADDITWADDTTRTHDITKTHDINRVDDITRTDDITRQVYILINDVFDVTLFKRPNQTDSYYSSFCAHFISSPVTDGFNTKLQIIIIEILLKGAKKAKSNRSMENREDFVDGYGYGYNSNQVYYDPAMQQGYYGNQGPVQHYGNWGWQGYNPHGAQGHGQAFYGGYHPMAYEYDYSYDEANGYNGNMGSGNARSFQNNPYQGQGQGLSQESSGKRSKYSYSQNRNKNRQRPETRQANQSDNNAGNKTDATIETASDVVANLNVNNNSDESKGTTSVNNKSEKKTLHSGSEVFYSVQDNQNISRTKPPDKSKYRGGRFQGSDSRTREFDRERQQLDRRRTYNTSYKSDKTTVGDTNSETVVKSDNSNTGDNDNHQVKEKANANQKEDRNGAKPKSFKDSKSSAYNDRYGNNKKSGYKNDSAVKTKSDGKDGGKESLQNKGGSTRNNERKGDTNVEDDVLSEGEKKVYSSSSPRERQGRASGYNSQREAYDRYNYRGQDYNKRHKEFPALGLERGGDRTKLTGSSDESQGVAKGDNTDDVEDSGEQTGTYAGPGRKPGGPGRGTRQRKPAKNAVWSCANCYHVFHLRCIKKWARSPNSIVTGSGTEKEGWRCPACQNLSFKFPNQYRCFCECYGGHGSREVVCGSEESFQESYSCDTPCNKCLFKDQEFKCTEINEKTGSDHVFLCDRRCNRKKTCGRHKCGQPCCVMRSNIACHLSDISCGMKCSKPLPCGKHCCIRPLFGGRPDLRAAMYQEKGFLMTLQSLKDSIEGNMGNSSSVNIGKYNQKDPPFVAGIEKALSDIVQSAKQSKQSSRSHAFASMNMNQRRLVHELAEFYGCTTQSYDYEPKKNVVASATRDKCWLPSITLTAMVQRELHPKAPPPIPHVHKEETLRQTNLASKQSTLLLGERESSPTLAEGWKIIGKKTRKPGTQATPKSAIGTIDKFESNLAEICSAGAINYESLSFQSKEALKSEPVVDYFDFTVN